MAKHPTQRCAPCDTDWPAIPEYNLCPRCQRCTYASSEDVAPDRKLAKAEAEYHERVRAFDAECDAAHAAATDAWVKDMNALLEQTSYIPDPPGAADLPGGAATTNYGLAGGLNFKPGTYNDYFTPPKTDGDKPHPFSKYEPEDEDA
jgi:hypothetical protein